MSSKLDNILFSYDQPNFKERLVKLRLSITEAATFVPGDVKYEQLIKILHSVATKGDKAIAEFTEKFDGVKLKPDEFRVSPDDLSKAHSEINAELLGSLRQAIKNVRKYQEEIFIGTRNTHPGIKYTSIRRVGVCIPGASAPLPSTVIMTVVPAQVAGVKEIAVVSPPRYKGSIDPVILAVCHELGIDEVYRIGGAQAVTALAVGTDSIAKVDKIVGPGNQWVQSAKKYYFGHVDIDSIAGPSEVLIIANDNANPAWGAAAHLF